MIKSTVKLKYDSRNRRKEAFIIIDIKEKETIEGTKRFEVIDSIITDEGGKMQISSKSYYQTPDQIDALDAYLLANNDFSGMGRTERDSLKLTLGLLFFVKNDFTDESKTEIIYGAIPSQFVLESEWINPEL